MLLFDASFLILTGKVPKFATHSLSKKLSFYLVYLNNVILLNECHDNIESPYF